MKLKTIASWTIVAVMLLASLVSIAWANHTIALFSFWSDTNGDALSVNQGTPADLSVYVSSNSDFYLSIKVYRGTTLVQNVLNSVFVPANSDNDYSNEFSISTVALAGKHTVEVLVDPVGADTFENKVLTLDVESSPTVNPLPDQDVNEGQTLQFTATGSDADGDTVTYVARKDCQGNWLCALAETFVPSTQNHLYSGMTFNQQSGQFSYSPNFATVTHPATEREFPLKIRAYDNSNQWSAWEYVTVTVNDVNRLPQFTSTPVTDATENAYYVYPLTAVDADAEDELTFSLASGSEGMLITLNNVLRWTPTFEQAGDYAVTLQVSDGLTAVPQSFTISVQNTNRAPVLAPIGDKQVNEGSTLSFTVTATDADGDQFGLSSTNLPAGATFNQQSGQFSWTPTLEQAGNYQVTFRAMDIFGDVGLETITITVGDVNQAPVVTPVDVQSVDEGETLTFTVSATDADGDDLTFVASGNWPAGATLINNWDGTATFSWTPDFTQAGTYELTFQVTDGATLVSETFAVTVRDVTQPTANQAPVLNPIGNQQVNEGEPLVIVVEASDPNDDALTFSTGALPVGATFNAAARTFSWTPSFTQAGTYAVSFAVSDGKGGMDTELVWITITDVVVPPGNQAPVLVAIGNKSVDEGGLLQFAVVASDPDGDTVTFRPAQNLPPGATFNEATGEFSWTPGFNQADVYPGVTFTVTDGLLFTSETITITVNDVPVVEPNQAPMLVSIGNKQTNEGQLLQFIVVASDPDGDTVTFRPAQNLPPGATFNEATGEFSWTPGFNQADVYPGVTFTVTDGLLFTSETITITVNDVPVVEPNQAPVLDAIGNRQVDEGQLLQFTVTASDADGDALTFSTGTLPEGASFNANTQTFSWTSSLEQAGTYAVTFVVTDTGNLVDSEEVVITVVDVVVPPANQAPVITALTVPSQLTVAQAGQFAAAATDADGDALTFTWNFGDGQTSNQQNPSHAYSAAGQYTVTVTVSDGQATVTDSGTVTVVPVVVPGCTEPTALNFNPQATFNDGSCQFSGKNVAIATVQIPEIASAGDYLAVNVIAKNSGNEQLKNLQITVLAYDLNTFGSSNTFTLNPGKSTSKLVYVPLPYDAWPGSYLVKITVDNGVARDSTYRQVWVQ